MEPRLKSQLVGRTKMSHTSSIFDSHMS